MLSLAYLVIRWIFGVVVWALRPSRKQALEIVVLRHQLEVVRRQVARAQFQPRDRVLLAAASRFLPRARWSSFAVRPETLLRWHRYLVTRRAARWGSKSRGRPPLPSEVKELVVRLANDNPLWGYKRIRGELLKLGHDVSAMTVRNILRRNGLGPAPRHSGPTWTEFLRIQADSILASDFFTAYSLWEEFSTYSSSSRSQPDESMSPGAPLVPTRPGSPSRLATSRCAGRIDPNPCDSLSTTATPSTAVASMASSELTASTSFALRSRHRAPSRDRRRFICSVCSQHIPNITDGNRRK